MLFSVMREQTAFVVQPAIGEGADQAHAQDRDRHARDGDGERSRRQRKRGERARRIGNDIHGSHGREVMRHDREREKQRRYNSARSPCHRTATASAAIASTHSEDDGCNDEMEGPRSRGREARAPHMPR